MFFYMFFFISLNIPKFYIAPHTPTCRNCRARKKNSVIVPKSFLSKFLFTPFEQIGSDLSFSACSWCRK